MSPFESMDGKDKSSNTISACCLFDWNNRCLLPIAQTLVLFQHSCLTNGNAIKWQLWIFDERGNHLFRAVWYTDQLKLNAEKKKIKRFQVVFSTNSDWYLSGTIMKTSNVQISRVEWEKDHVHSIYFLCKLSFSDCQFFETSTSARNIFQTYDSWSEIRMF